MLPRVFVTGVGIVSSIGLGRDAFYRSLENGTSGISPVSLFDPSQLGRCVAGEVHGFDPNDHLTQAEQHRMGRCSAMAVAAARMAITDANLRGDEIVGPRTAVVVGTTMGEAEILGGLQHELDCPRPSGRTPLVHPQVRVDASPYSCGACDWSAGYGPRVTGSMCRRKLCDRVRRQILFAQVEPMLSSQERQR